MTDQPSDQPGEQPHPGGLPPGQQPPTWGPPEAGQQPPAWGQQPQPPSWPAQPGQWQAPPGQQWGPPAPGGPGGPVAPYGYPGYGAYGPAVPQTAGRATTVMVLGIVSLVMMFTCGLGFVTAIIALVMAPGAKREIAESGGRLTGESQVRAGSIMSWITLGLTALAVLLFAVIIGIAVSVDDTTSGVGGPVVSPG